LKTNFLKNATKVKEITKSNIFIILFISGIFTIIDYLFTSITPYIAIIGIFLYFIIKVKLLYILDNNTRLHSYTLFKEMSIKDFLKYKNIPIIKMVLYNILIGIFLFILINIITYTKTPLLLYIFIVYVLLLFMNINIFFVEMIKNKEEVTFKRYMGVLNILNIRNMVLNDNYFNTFMWILSNYIYLSLTLLFMNISIFLIFENIYMLFTFFGYIFVVINIFNDYIYYNSIIEK